MLDTYVHLSLSLPHTIAYICGVDENGPADRCAVAAVAHPDFVAHALERHALVRGLIKHTTDKEKRRKREKEIRRRMKEEEEDEEG